MHGPLWRVDPQLEDRHAESAQSTRLVLICRRRRLYSLAITANSLETQRESSSPKLA